MMMKGSPAISSSTGNAAFSTIQTMQLWEMQSARVLCQFKIVNDNEIQNYNTINRPFNSPLSIRKQLKIESNTVSTNETDLRCSQAI